MFGCITRLRPADDAEPHFRLRFIVLVLLLAQSLEIVRIGERYVCGSSKFDEPPDFLFLTKRKRQARNDGKRLQLGVFIIVEGKFNLVVFPHQAVVLYIHFDFFALIVLTVVLLIIILIDHQNRWSGFEGLNVLPRIGDLMADRGNTKHHVRLGSLALADQSLARVLRQMSGKVVLAFSHQHFKQGLPRGLRWRRGRRRAGSLSLKPERASETKEQDNQENLAHGRPPRADVPATYHAILQLIRLRERYDGSSTAQNELQSIISRGSNFD